MLYVSQTYKTHGAIGNRSHFEHQLVGLKHQDLNKINHGLPQWQQSSQ